MISELCIYWITGLDKIQSALNVIGSICGVGLTLCFFIGGITYMIEAIEESKDYEKAKEIRQYFFEGFLISTIALASIVTTSILIPTSKELAAMYVIPKVANNEKVQGIGSEIVSLAEGWIKELKPNTKAIGKEDVNGK